MKKIALSLFVVAASGAYVWQQAGRAAPDDVLGMPAVSSEDTTGSILQPVSVPAETAPPPAAVRPALFVVNQPPAAPATSPADDQPLPAPVADAAPAPAPVAVDAAPSPDAAPQTDVAVAAEAQVPQDAPALAPVQPAPDPVDVPLPRPRPAFRQSSLGSLTPVSMTVAATNAAYKDGTYIGPVTDAYYGLIQIEAIVQGGRLTGVKVLKYPSDRRTSVYINRQALPMLRDEAVTAQSARVNIISGATLTSRAFIQSLGGALKQAKS